MPLVLIAALLLASLVLASGHPNDPPEGASTHNLSSQADSSASSESDSDSSDTSNGEAEEEDAESSGEESPYFPPAPEERVPPNWENGGAVLLLSIDVDVH